MHKLGTIEARKIISKLPFLENYTNQSSNIKRMRSTNTPLYRWRVGNLRIIFKIDHPNKTILIIDLGYRGSIYSQ